MIIAILVLVLLIVILAANIRVVPQTYSYVIERLGKYHKTWGAGIHIKAPLIDRIVKKVTMKEKVGDFPPQPVITKDNVTMQVDTVIYYQITDSKLYTYGVENPENAIENLTATTLRNCIGSLELDQSLVSRDAINSQMRSILDTATDPWGIKVNRVEIKNIMPPAKIQEAMEKQMRAEREKREAILNAEGQKQAQITEAEGRKESMILDAEAKKSAKILNAEAERDAAIKEAEGQAQAILIVQKAQAQALEALSKVNISNEVLRLKSFESLEKVANGNATKLIVPSDIQSMATNLAEVKAVALEKD